jgi:hypothetical protein
VLLQGFYHGIWSASVVHVSTGVDDAPAGFGDARATGTTHGRCNSGGVAVRGAPEPGPVRGDRGELYDLFSTRPRRPSVGRRVRFPQPPSIGLRIADSSLSCEWAVRVDAHAPFDKGRLRGLETRPSKRLHGFARWGSVPFARDRGRGGSPSMGSPRLAALAGSRTRHVRHARAGGLEERLECACPRRP